MAVYIEVGHKGSTRVMQEVPYKGANYLIDSDGVVREAKSGTPEVKDKEIIEAVKKAGA